MFKKTILFCGLLFSLSLSAGTPSYDDGGDVGNGGDAVYCHSSSENSFSGYYSLDYLAKYDPENPAVQVHDLEVSLNRIESALQQKLPGMLESFKEFRASLFNEADFSRRHIWEKAPFGLIDLKDEKLVSRLPDNCLQDDKIKLVQAVIRQSPQKLGLPNDKINYKFVPQVVDELRKQGPTQLSFLLIHEWLWDFSKNVERNRKVNYWLHSNFLERWSSDQWASNLEGIGFEVPEAVVPEWYGPSCEPDPKNISLVSSGFTGPFYLGQGKAYKRTGTWNRESGWIEPFTDVSLKFQNKMGSHFSLYLGENGLSVRHTLSDRYLFHCSIDKAGAPTSCLWTPEGSSNIERDVKLEPVVGKNCVLFRGHVVSTKGSMTTVDEIAFYFSKLRFP